MNAYREYIEYAKNKILVIIEELLSIQDLIKKLHFLL